MQGAGSNVNVSSHGAKYSLSLSTAEGTNAQRAEMGESIWSAAGLYARTNDAAPRQLPRSREAVY
jgi:hypothetical protein